MDTYQKSDLLIKISPKEIQKLFNEDKSDHYDILIVVGSGVIGDIIDIFLVGISGECSLDQWADRQTNQAVVSFAEKLGFDKKNK